MNSFGPARQPHANAQDIWHKVKGLMEEGFAALPTMPRFTVVTLPSLAL